jgi:hypothetical protein
MVLKAGESKGKHVTISVPADIIDAIKEAIIEGRLKGYRNHHQFCQEAIRLRFQQLMVENIDVDEIIKVIKKREHNNKK